MRARQERSRAVLGREGYERHKHRQAVTRMLLMRSGRACRRLWFVLANPAARADHRRAALRRAWLSHDKTLKEQRAISTQDATHQREPCRIRAVNTYIIERRLGQQPHIHAPRSALASLVEAEIPMAHLFNAKPSHRRTDCGGVNPPIGGIFPRGSKHCLTDMGKTPELEKRGSNPVLPPHARVRHAR